MGGVGGGAGAELGVWEAAGPQAFQSVSGQRVKQEPAMAATREPVGAVRAPYTLTPGPWTLNPEPWTLNPGRIPFSW